MYIYNLSINLYETAINLAALFNQKASTLKKGRQSTFKNISQFKRDQSKKLLWVHCASLGEFEQARPIIESLKSHCDIQLAVSFFSPSGYELRKNYPLADVVFYLPKDTTTNAEKLIEVLKPDAVAVVKYEIWINLIDALYAQKIPLVLVSANFRPDHIYFKWYGKNHLNALKKFNYLFTQNHNSLNILQKAGLQNGLFSNDTRFDRVYQNHLQKKELPLVQDFKQNQTTLILGSSYQQEEEMVTHLLKEYPDGNFKIIIAPHQINASRINGIEKMFAKHHCVKYSALMQNPALAAQSRVLIIDNIGMLSNLYQYAELAFIGGGFEHKGIHNTLEAAAFGMPIFIGPFNHQKFPETLALKNHGILFTVTNAENFTQLCKQFIQAPLLVNQIKNKSQEFIKGNLGATELVCQKIKPWLLAKQTA